MGALCGSDAPIFFVNMEDRDFKGVWIPKEIWLDESLSVVEKCLIAEIDSLSKGSKGCFASNEYLGKFIGVSSGRCANIICDLRKRGYIKTSFFDGKNRGVKVCLNAKKPSRKRETMLHENVNEPSRKRETMLHENVNRYNTVINTDREREPTPEKHKFLINEESRYTADILEQMNGPKLKSHEELESEVAAWCKENWETLKMWYSLVGVKIDSQNTKDLVTKFISYYSMDIQFNRYPIRFFTGKFKGWLVNEKTYLKKSNYA
jgi:hypothetical protein